MCDYWHQKNKVKVMELDIVGGFDLRRQWRISVALFASMLILSLLPPFQVSSSFVNLEDDIDTSPFVDRIVFLSISNPSQRIQALQAATTQMDTCFFDPANRSSLEQDPDIEVYEALRHGYGHITINCREYPLNISGFRRAFAYAFDKNQVTNEVMNGLSKEHDSMIPYANPWCIEDELELHYYQANIAIGNQILDDLDFIVNASRGYRESPNGDPFKVTIGYLSLSEVHSQIADIAVEALGSLNIEADKVILDCFCGYEPWENFNMVVLENNYDEYDITWLASEFWSENVNDITVNPSGFSNATFDSLRNQLLSGAKHEDVSEAAAEMQEILHYNVPRLVVYQNIYLQAYRTDWFTGYVEDLSRHMTGPWTMLNIQRADGGYEGIGGTVLISTDAKPADLNFFNGMNSAERNILENLHLSLFTPGPNLEPYPRLAKSVTIETHADNEVVPLGYTRYSFDIVDGIKWSDDAPVTAQDVVFTFQYALESGSFGNPAGDDLSYLSAVYAPTDNKVVFEFSTESYWHLNDIVYDYILPKHAFNRSVEEWEDWNPFFNETEPLVNCGPFILTDFEDDEYYELTVSPNWRRDPYGPYSSYEARILPRRDLLAFSQSFTIRWNINWELVSASSSALGIISDNEFRPAFSPAHQPFRYTLLLDGVFYLSGVVGDYSYPPPDHFDVHVNDPSLTTGQYNFTIIVETGIPGVQTDTVIVSILLPTPAGFFVVGIFIPLIIAVVVRISGMNRFRRMAPDFR
ncbi:MAG: ABC transporter substrate-binding protein [Candidatus Thorarchaeota archaeon]